MYYLRQDFIIVHGMNGESLPVKLWNESSCVRRFDSYPRLRYKHIWHKLGRLPRGPAFDEQLLQTGILMDIIHR